MPITEALERRYEEIIELAAEGEQIERRERALLKLKPAKRVVTAQRLQTEKHHWLERASRLGV